MRVTVRTVLVSLAVLAALGLLPPPESAAKRERLVFRHVPIDLPGPPARIVPADLNGDGAPDLAVDIGQAETSEHVGRGKGRTGRGDIPGFRVGGLPGSRI